MISVLTHVIVALYSQYWKSPCVSLEDMFHQKKCKCIEMYKFTLILNGESD